MTKIVHFKVGMTCSGCAEAVDKVLKRINGVREVKADAVGQHVQVTCDDSVSNADLLEALQKWASVSKKSVELI